MSLRRLGWRASNLDFCFGVAAGDYDNDGYTDLFICDAGQNALYHNNGDGTFTDVTARPGWTSSRQDLLSVCAAWFDYDNDGLLDLVVSQYTYWNPANRRRASAMRYRVFTAIRHGRQCSAHALP